MPINSTIAKMYPSTADAVLVDKWFAKHICNIFDEVIAESFSVSLLGRAKELEAAEEAKAEEKS